VTYFRYSALYKCTYYYYYYFKLQCLRTRPGFVHAKAGRSHCQGEQILPWAVLKNEGSARG